MTTRRSLYNIGTVAAAHLKRVPTLAETKALENYYKQLSNVFAFGVTNIMIKNGTIFCTLFFCKQCCNYSKSPTRQKFYCSNVLNALTLYAERDERFLRVARVYYTSFRSHTHTHMHTMVYSDAKQ